MSIVGFLVLVLLFIFTQVLCRPRDFDGAWKRGAHLHLHGGPGGYIIYGGNGVSNFWTIFPLRVCTNYPHGLRGGSLTLEDQLLVRQMP